jgi:hypothetical protein
VALDSLYRALPLTRAIVFLPNSFHLPPDFFCRVKVALPVGHTPFTGVKAKVAVGTSRAGLRAGRPGLILR